MSTKCEEWRAKRSAAPPLALHNHALLSLLYLPLRTSHFALRTTSSHLALHFTSPFLPRTTYFAPRTSHFALLLRTNPNIVGYSTFGNQVDDGTGSIVGGRNIGVGGLFVPVAGGETFKLGEIKPVFDPEEEDPMDPEGEYIQELNQNGSAVIGRYTYISKEYCDLDPELQEFLPYVGWWDVTNQGIFEAIEDDANKADNKEITVGTAFLGSLSTSVRNFTSAGSVPLASTGFSNDGNRNPFFLNYLPVEITLGKLGMSFDEEEEDPIDPEGEYLQVLNPNGSAVIGRYTYISKEYCDLDPELQEFLPFVGWWNVTELGIFEAIEDDANKADGLKLAPGFSFLGSLSTSIRNFNFPSSLDKAE